MRVADIFKYEKFVKYNFQTPYSNIQRVEYILKGLGIVNINREFMSNSVEWEIEAPDINIIQ